MTVANEAAAHTEEELDQWLESWQTDLNDARSEAAMLEYQDMRARHGWYWGDPIVLPHSSFQGIGTDVSQWEPLVMKYFGPELTPTALCVMSYESGGNPGAKNPRSTARGLFQLLASLWAPYFGVSYEDLFDPELNVRLAKQVYDIQGWQAWTVYRLCR